MAVFLTKFAKKKKQERAFHNEPRFFFHWKTLYILKFQHVKATFSRCYGVFCVFSCTSCSSCLALLFSHSSSPPLRLLLTFFAPVTPKTQGLNKKHPVVSIHRPQSSSSSNVHIDIYPARNDFVHALLSCRRGLTQIQRLCLSLFAVQTTPPCSQLVFQDV